MRILFISTAFIVFLSSAKAQFPADIGASLRQKPEFFFSLTGYTSFIRADWATFSGARLGLNYNETVKLGIGISHLSSSVVNPVVINENDHPYTTNGILHFTYAEASFEYIFYKNDLWEISVPANIGVGRAHYNYISRSLPGLARSPSYTVCITEPELSAQYDLLECAGINASLGYLASLHAPPRLKGNFNSVTFSVGFSLFLDEIWKNVMQKK